MTNDEEVNPQDRIDRDFQLYQIENNIFYNGDEPIRDNRFRCYEYSLFLFYKSNSNIQIGDITRSLQNSWTCTGQWELGDYKVIQYDGPGPILYVYQNYNILKNRMDSLQNRGEILTYRIRKRYPELP